MGEIRALADQLTVHLKNVSLTTQDRDKKRVKHSIAWQLGLGNSSNAKNAKYFKVGEPFVREIPSRPGRCARVRPVLENPNIPAWKKEIWILCSRLITLLNKEWAGEKEEFSVSLSRLDSPDQFVLEHVDGFDICRQIVIYLGDFSGARLRLHSDPKGKGAFEDVELFPGIVLNMDGRLPHALIVDPDFKGVRYGVFFFKHFDSRIQQEEPPISPHVVVGRLF